MWWKLPDNKSQPLKKLEAMERRLLRNPEHARAYDRQMREVKELQFARKWTGKEAREYAGPVHYISHHEVFETLEQKYPGRNFQFISGIPSTQIKQLVRCSP